MSLRLVSTYVPSATSLKLRSEIAQSIKGLRRTKPNVPFWCLPSHRVPTLWSLYRNLLKAAPSNNLRWRVWAFFQWNKGLISPSQTRDKLKTAYKLLDSFNNANEGDERTREILVRYDRMISTKRRKTRAENIYRKEAAWLRRLRKRPILTGTYRRATKFHVPLPVLKPQPAYLSLMIRRRVLARDRRINKDRTMISRMLDLIEERKFETRLMKKTKGEWKGEPVFSHKDWILQLSRERKQMGKRFDRENERAKVIPSEQLLSIILEARREKIRNKTRERERERRGATTYSSLKRRRKGIPPHIRERLSEEQRHIDAVSRSLSEVGYVALVKSRKGQRLKDDKTWREMECGRAENQVFLNLQNENSVRINLQRRAQAEALKARDHSTL